MLQTCLKRLSVPSLKFRSYGHTPSCPANKQASILDNKVAVITGGAVGIGHEIADRFLEKGAKAAVLLDINETQGKQATEELNCKHGAKKSIFMKCDVTKDLEAVSKEIFATYKNVHVLVNNAGILNEPNPTKVVDINLTALINWSFIFWNHMRKDKGGAGGTIMNLSSIYGFRVDPYIPVYQATKFGIMGFTRSLGHPYHFQKTGVRVVSINPGFTETELTENFTTLPEVHKDFLEFVKTQPWQKVKVVGNAAVCVLEKAESGTAWLIEGSNPVAEIKHCYDVDHCK
ncbi:15-hydroxyprostaglandin dehydrogenase [NAD(+)]-like [Cydia fagiglandana]|uniref:15-hydroxyprostaglandin dehydrogenase [NAD(+)]-like n=1 Tax=Cydia fagiglandana TaxID=1458189 RepID=UPI002FEE4055